MASIYQVGNLVINIGGGLLAAPNPSPGVFNPQYPRLGSMRFGVLSYSTTPYLNDPAIVSWLSYRCVLGIGQGYTGDSVNYYGTRQGWVSSQKANTKVSGGNKIFQYVNPRDIPTDSSGQQGSYGTWAPTVKANSWFLYIAGSPVYPTNTDYFTNGQWVCNSSSYSPTDGSAQNYPQFFANWSYEFLISGTGPNASSNPSADASQATDGIYADEIWYAPLGDSDVERTGTTQTGISAVYETGSSGLPLVANNWRAGEAQFWTQLETLLPNRLRMGNVNYVEHIWEQTGYSATTGMSATNMGAMNQVLDIAEVQYYLGWGFTEGIASFEALVVGYQVYEAMLRTSGPHMPYIDIRYLSGVGDTNQANPNVGNGIPGSAAQTWNSETGFPATYTEAYRGMRYYTAFILIFGSGIISCDGDVVYADVNLQTYDEWGDYGTAAYGSGWIGLPDATTAGNIQSVTAPKYSNGIQERRFYNATKNQYFRAVLNHRGNGTQTYAPTDASGNRITLYKMRGTQNTSYNNATSFSSLTMADPDGLIACESPQ